MRHPLLQKSTLPIPTTASPASVVHKQSSLGLQEPPGDTRRYRGEGATNKARQEPLCSPAVVIFFCGSWGPCEAAATPNPLS